MHITKFDLSEFILTYQCYPCFIELVYSKTFSNSEYITCAVNKRFGFPDSDLVAFYDVLTHEEVYCLPLFLCSSEAYEEVVVKGQRIIDVRLLDLKQYQELLNNYQKKENLK